MLICSLDAVVLGSMEYLDSIDGVVWSRTRDAPPSLEMR